MTLMRRVMQTLLCVVGVVAAVFSASPLVAQGRAPRTPFGTSDFAKLKWLEGNWQGTASGEQPLYERIRFVDDSTAELSFYRDPSFSNPTATGRLYLSVGRIYHTFGSSQWVATRAGGDGLFFVPQTAARNNFAWTYKSGDAWTSTMRTGIGGHERVIVYEMTRVKP